ncbi:hypothetical protein [Pseudonocardia cypriaca]|nr:hypothetical protein [Pseudonocardia cypriaca]
MPERNEKVAEWNEQLATEAERPQSEQARSEQTRSEQTRSEQARSEQARSEQTVPEQRRSDETAPEQARSDETAPEEPRPGQPAAAVSSTPETRTDQVDSGRMSSEQTSSGQTAQPDAGQRERLVPKDRAASYGARWDAVKGSFVDEPREAVAQADALVGELLDELETLFHEQRRSIEQGLDADETSTEDLRLALRRYRSFFERLLAV